MSLSDHRNSSLKECASEASTSISTFVIKIFNLLNDPENAQAICWHSDGASFLIKDTALLTSRVLPVYFRHSNYQSFIRQLNMYSFAKLKDHSVHRFRNPYFLREKEELLKFIKRKPEKKKRRQSDDSIESQKENQLRGATESNLNTPMQLEEPKCPEVKQEAKVEEPEVAEPCSKRVRFEETVKDGASVENISTIIEATSKWINHKEESCWGNIKSAKSIELSMKLIGNDDEEEARPSGRVLGYSTLEHPIILLFNPNLSERTIRSIGHIANSEE